MPGITERAIALRDLYRARKRIIFEPVDSDTDAVDEEMEQNLEFTCTILSQRTLKRPCKYRNKNFNADAAFQGWITDTKYVVFTHMSRASFLCEPELISVFDLMRAQVRAFDDSGASRVRQPFHSEPLPAALCSLAAVCCSFTSCLRWRWLVHGQGL